MKIAIISINMYSKMLNFACPLHTYAFQQFLLENGIDCTVLDYKPNYYGSFDLRHPCDYYQRKLSDKRAELAHASTEEEAKITQQTIEELEKDLTLWKPLEKMRETRYDKFQAFIDKNYIRTEKCYDPGLLEVEDPGFDCYICATDVIWKNSPSFGFDRGFFLGCSSMESKHKIAYSVSRGVYYAKTEADKEQFFYYLKDFDSISVREKTLQKYIEENSDIKAELTLDPVLLHDRDFYEKLCVKPPEEHYVLLYYVVEQAKETIRQSTLYARAHNMKIIEITDVPVGEGRLKAFPGVDYTLRYDIGIEEWLGYIRYADCIFTNSFHGCCLSLIFEKQFFAGHRNSEKVSLLMDLFNLQYRQLATGGDPVASDPADIDYEKVRPLLQKKREESASYILGAIRKAENTPRKPHDYSERKKKLRYHVQYNSGRASDKFESGWDESAGKLEHFASGSWEYVPNEENKVNDGNSRLDPNCFKLPHFQFAGWRLRLQIYSRWYWVMEDGSLELRKEKQRPEKLKVFKDNAPIPFFPVNDITLIVAEAVWDPPLLLRALRAVKHALPSGR